MNTTIERSYPFTWEDQPGELSTCEVLLLISTDASLFEIRKGNDCYYLTAGSLFESQTLKCVDADAALRALHAATHSKSKSLEEAPPGTELMT